MLGLLVGFAALCVLIVMPLLLLAGLARALFALVSLPFRLVGLVLHLSLGAMGLVLKLAFGILGLVVGIVFIPLLPILLVGLVIWAFVKLLAPTAAVAR